VNARSSGQVDAVLAEGGRRVYQCIGALDPEFCREPRPLQDPQLSPLWRCKIVLRR